MLNSVEHLIRNGFAVHRLRKQSKAPVADDWSTLPVATLEELRRQFQPGQNLGARLGEPSKVAGGYLHLLDVDIRDPLLADEARRCLREILPEVDELPTVASGSGGASRHHYFVSDQAFRSKKLAHSAEKMVGPDGKTHWRWEIELFGTGKQAVIPPSIHPDTGNAYRWEREFDFDLFDLGCGPFVPAARVAAWGANVGGSVVEEDDDLLALTRKRPMGLSKDEIDAILADLPTADWCDDRDGWLQVGMALHHEFEGRPEGLVVWNAFSKRSDKYDREDQARVWRSFAGKANPLRMATLVKAAAIARLNAGHDGDGFEDDTDEDDDEDLLGDTPAAEVDDIMSIGDGATDKTLEWRSRLDVNEEGVIKPTLHNVELIIRNDPRTRGVPRLNEFTNEVVQRGLPGRKELKKKSPKGVRQLTGPVWVLRDTVNGDLWTDEKDNAIRSIIETPIRQGGYGLKVSDRDLKAAVDLIARDDSFHPVREYLETLVWDGVPRLETLFIRYLGAEDSPYTRNVGRLTLLGGVTRIFEPGHKFDFAPILEGLQGKRKSTFIGILAKSWFSELDGDFHDTKQMIELMQGAWLLEIPELSGFGRADVRQIKAFISRQSDKGRLAYARRAQVFARQCIFMGSTNDRGYLRDDTGGRRFWPVECSVDEIDTAGLLKEVDQLWAEAVAGYRAMRKVQPHGTLPLYLSDAAAKEEALRIQEDRRVETAEDALMGQIAHWLDKPTSTFDDVDDEDDLVGGTNVRNATCLIEIWVECLGKDIAAYGPSQAQTIGRAMQRVPGWFSTGLRYTEKYGRQRVYWRTDYHGI